MTKYRKYNIYENVMPGECDTAMPVQYGQQHAKYRKYKAYLMEKERG